MKKNLYFTLGIPGSGKSPLLRGKEPIVSTDEIRKQLFGDVNFWSREQEVFGVAQNRIINYFSSYQTVYLDATMVESKHRDPFLAEIKEEVEDVKFTAILFEADVELSRQRIKQDLSNGFDRASNALKNLYEFNYWYQETLELIEKKKVSFAVVKATNWGCTCQTCGVKYTVDVIVSDELWNKIRPEDKKNGAGLLCGSCIMKRLENILGYSAYNLIKI